MVDKEYQKRWRELNKDKLRQYRLRYDEKHKDTKSWYNIRYKSIWNHTPAGHASDYKYNRTDKCKLLKKRYADSERGKLMRKLWKIKHKKTTKSYNSTLKKIASSQYAIEGAW